IVLQVVGLACVFGLVKELLSASGSTTKILTFISVIAVTTLIVLLLRRLKLKVDINDKRIKYKMTPLHSKSHKIKWDEIASCEIIKTSKSAHWHGGNLNHGELKYSLTGRNGLSILTKEGIRYFIGINDLDSLRDKIRDLSVS
ncbi:hypothetical protein N9L92_02680, partial [Saprospiraceae bacterium]|nr:hypothetical protein [Saprospiraceae bacterium]